MSTKLKMPPKIVLNIFTKPSEKFDIASRKLLMTSVKEAPPPSGAAFGEAEFGNKVLSEKLSTKFLDWSTPRESPFTTFSLVVTSWTLKGFQSAMESAYFGTVAKKFERSLRSTGRKK